MSGKTCYITYLSIIYIYIYSIDTVLNETEIKEKYVRNTPELVKQ